MSNIFCHNIEQIDDKIDKGSNMSNQTSLILGLSVCILHDTILLTESDRNIFFFVFSLKYFHPPTIGRDWLAAGKCTNFTDLMEELGWAGNIRFGLLIVRTGRAKLVHEKLAKCGYFSLRGL